jgi:SSS family solute:Na+ symporter
MQISNLDLAIIVLYMVAMLVLGLWASRKKHAGHLTGGEYFLAGRNLSWGVVGAALFSANISTIHMVGLAASGYNEGLVWGNFEWMASIMLVQLSLVFAPFYFRSRISTLPEYLERRFSAGSRTCLAVMGIAAALFIHIGMSLYAGAAVFEQFFGVNVYTSIFLISVIVAIYTIVGGLKAVVVTETVQTVILLGGALITTIYAILALPERGVHNFAEFQAALRPGQLSMIHQSSDAGLAWYAVLLGFPVNGIWYWCTDQTITQRLLAAHTERDARLGPLFAGFLKILPVFLLILPGVIGYVLFKDIIGTNANQTLPVLINQLVPTGLKGLIAAGILAALMSSISAALNSSGTLVAVDIAAKIKPGLTDAMQVRIGRISATVVMILAMMWSTQGGRYTSIFEAINAIGSDLSPPITAVFLLGVFWRRGTWQASLATLSFGFLMGITAFIVDLPVFGDTKLLTQGLGMPFLMQAWWMFCICCLVFVVVSYLTPPPGREQVENLTWERPIDAIVQGKFSGMDDARLLGGLLLLLLAVLYWIFR